MTDQAHDTSSSSDATVARVRSGRRFRGDSGDSGPLEAVILLPAVLVIFGLILAFGRTTGSGGDVEHAARAGARAAASAQTSGVAEANARRVVDATLADAGIECVSKSVSVAADMQPGGRVTVSVSCVVELSDLTDVAAVPGNRTMTASASEPVDRQRGV